MFKYIIELIIATIPSVFAYFIFNKTIKNEREIRNQEYLFKLNNEKIKELYDPVYRKYLLNFLVTPQFPVDCGDISLKLEVLYSIHNIIELNLRFLEKTEKDLFFKFHTLIIDYRSTQLNFNSDMSYINSDEILGPHFENLINTYKELHKILMQSYTKSLQILQLPSL